MNVKKIITKNITVLDWTAQGVGLSPLIFNYAHETIMRKLNKRYIPKIKIGRVTGVNCLAIADYPALLSNNLKEATNQIETL